MSPNETSYIKLAKAPKMIIVELEKSPKMILVKLVKAAGRCCLVVRALSS